MSQHISPPSHWGISGRFHGENKETSEGAEPTLIHDGIALHQLDINFVSLLQFHSRPVGGAGLCASFVVDLKDILPIFLQTSVQFPSSSDDPSDTEVVESLYWSRENTWSGITDRDLSGILLL